MYPTVAKPSVVIAVPDKTVPGKIEGRKSRATVRFGSPGWEGDARTGDERRGG
jgi:hypothetical protein